jgi:hypothetical protein
LDALRSLKVLAVLLTGIVARIERDLGPIEISQSKLDELAGKKAKAST